MYFQRSILFTVLVLLYMLFYLVQGKSDRKLKSTKPDKTLLLPRFILIPVWACQNGWNNIKKAWDVMTCCHNIYSLCKIKFKPVLKHWLQSLKQLHSCLVLSVWILPIISRGLLIYFKLCTYGSAIMAHPIFLKLLHGLNSGNLLRPSHYLILKAWF